MEMRHGYKQTEVGIIPEDWKVKPLKCISPRQSVGLVINPSTYFDKAGEIPLLVGSNVSENFINATDARCITRASNDLLSASRLAAGDLVTVRVGEPGVTAVVPPELDGCNCASMMIVRQHESFDSYWLCYVMNSRPGRRQVEHVQYGTAQKQFNISDAVNFTYAVPPLSEQRAIARALKGADALLVVLDRLTMKKRDLKRAAMQQLLTGRTRISGFSGQWVEKRLDHLADIRSGGTPNTREARYWDGDLLWCTPTDITALGGSKYLRSTARRITHEGLSSCSAELIPERSVVMTSRATIGECAINTVTLCTNQGFKSFVPFDSVDAEFLYYLLSTQKEGFMRLCGGSTFLEIGKAQLSSYSVHVPSSKAEQTAIGAALSDMDAEIFALEHRREKTLGLRDAMMQGLLTGRTRLLSPEAMHA